MYDSLCRGLSHDHCRTELLVAFAQETRIHLETFWEFYPGPVPSCSLCLSMVVFLTPLPTVSCHALPLNFWPLPCKFSKAHLMNLGTSWLCFGRVEWVRNELKVLNGCSIKNNYRFIWFNSVILCLQSTFNEFGDQLTGFWTSWTGPNLLFPGPQDMMLMGNQL